MAELLSPHQIETLRQRAASLGNPRTMVIDVLRTIQDQCGWVSDEGILLAADLLGLKSGEVEQVASFYSEIFRQSVGRYPIHICNSICCWSRGGAEIAAHLQQLLGIAMGETTPDGLFTLLHSCCLGGCGRAPAVMIGRRFYAHLTPEELTRMIAELRAEAAV